MVYIRAASQERKGLDLPSYLPDPQRGVFKIFLLGRAHCLMLSPLLELYRRDIQKLGSGAYGEVPTWRVWRTMMYPVNLRSDKCDIVFHEIVGASYIYNILYTCMLQFYNHCEHLWLVPVEIQCWMQVHLCEDSRNNSQATSRFNLSIWHSNTVSSRLIDLSCDFPGRGQGDSELYAGLAGSHSSAQGWSDMSEVVGFGVFDMLFRNR